MGFAEEMTNLGENFLDSFNERINFLGRLPVEVKKIKRNTHKFLGDFRRQHKAMSRKQRNDLHNFTNHLTNTVSNMLNKFHKHQHQIHLECKAGHNAFQKVLKTMANKRKNFPSEFKKAQQKFERKTH